MKITEAFAKKLAVAESVYSAEHGGQKLSNMKKIAIARVLANESEFLKESFENSVGTQLSAMKTFKKFCLDLTTVALPNLIANDLVIVYPMKSRTGYIQYMQFTLGSNKGGVKQGQAINDPFKLGAIDEDRVNYTSAAVVEPYTGDGAKKEFKLMWTPANKPTKITIDDVETTDFTFADGVVILGTAPAEGAAIKIAYTYDNVVIPQNDIPVVNAHMEGLGLEAKARRVEVYYSQMAAFQAKTEMGIDLGEVLATQACAELSYEIDTEIVNLLVNTAIANRDYEDLIFNKCLPYGVSMRDHYASFAETIERASQHIYDLTQKHAANYMIIASNIKPMFALMEGWKAASTAKINGPYFAGTLNGLKVYVSPAVPAGRYVLGYNGDDMVTSAAVYAPYMAVVPTQLLGFADGSMNQGFSTMYDLVILNDMLLAAGKVINEKDIIKVENV